MRSDCRYDDIEGIEDAIFGFSTPELEEIFINLDLSQLELRSEEESKGQKRLEQLQRLCQKYLPSSNDFNITEYDKVICGCGEIGRRARFRS